MKAIVTIILTIGLSNVNAQQLKDIEWVRLLTETKVDGKIVTTQLLGAESLKYIFKEKTALISLNDEYSKKMKYSFSDSILSIGDFLNYKVDTLTEQVFIARELSRKGIIGDQSFTFLNTDYLFDYLKETQQLAIIGDSMILASNLFSPAYNGDLDTLLLEQLGTIRNDMIFTGSFTISKNGDITDIQIPLTKKMLKKDVERISSILRSTRGSWIIPPTPKPIYYKINFKISVRQFEPLISIFITFHPNN